MSESSEHLDEIHQPTQSNYPHLHHDAQDPDSSALSAQKPLVKTIVLSILLIAFVLVVLFMLMTTYIVRNKYSSRFVPPSSSSTHQFPIDTENILTHLRQLSHIGESHQGSGRTARGGYNDSAAYVENILHLSGQQHRFQDAFSHEQRDDLTDTDPYFFYRRQYLDTWDFKVNEEEALFSLNNHSLALNTDYKLLHFSGRSKNRETQQIARVVFIPNYGCVQEDYQDLLKEPFFGGDTMLLVKRGDCDFKTKAELSFNNGANALVIYNEGNTPEREGLFSGTLGAKINNGIGPVLAVPYQTAQQWKKLQEEGQKLHISLFLDTTISSFRTFNLIMDVASTLKDAEANKLPTIVVGSHLDGVDAGPGVNDNGSGSMSTLEIARTFMERGVRPKNHLRFCFWAAEENGLVGSEYYVAHISESELNNIAMNLNFDMLGSPNYIRGLYEAKTSPIEEMIAPSEKLQKVFERYFEKHEMSYKFVPFNGRSDYGPFLDKGIPASGLDSGSDEWKTVEDRSLFGGMANAPLDACYHKSCDSFENINIQAIEELATAAGEVVWEFSDMSNLKEYIHN